MECERLVATEGLRTLMRTIVVTKDRLRSVQDKTKKIQQFRRECVCNLSEQTRFFEHVNPTFVMRHDCDQLLLHSSP